MTCPDGCPDGCPYGCTGYCRQTTGGPCPLEHEPGPEESPIYGVVAYFLCFLVGVATLVGAMTA